MRRYIILNENDNEASLDLDSKDLRIEDSYHDYIHLNRDEALILLKFLQDIEEILLIVPLD